MPAPILPCEHCAVPVPRFVVGDNEFQAVVKAFSDGSRTLAAAELKHFVRCSDAEAQAWVDHLSSCAHAWPSDAADQHVLRCIDAAFEGVSKPEHFTNYSHCDECEEHDNTLRQRARATLRREDLGNAGWDPITFSSAHGIGYLFPALARFALLPDAWKSHSWYGSQLLSHLSWDGSSNRFLAWCSTRQANAVYDLLRHLAATRRDAIERHGDEEALRVSLAAWQPPDLPTEQTGAAPTT